MQGGVSRAAGGNPAEDAFLGREPAHGGLGVVLADIDDAVHAAAVEDFRQVFLGPAPDAGNARAIARLQADDLDRRIHLLEVARYAHDGAGGAHGTDEVRHGSFGVAPDLLAGFLEMGERVVGIGELVEQLAFAAPVHLDGQVPGAFHAFLFGDGDEFGAVGGHRSLAFLAHVGGHDEFHAIALDRRGHGERDAGIAAGRLDEYVAGGDIAAFLGLLDHAHGGAVLDGAGGIVAFELHQHMIAGPARHALQADEGRVADQAFDRRIFHESGPAIRGRAV